MPIFGESSTPYDEIVEKVTAETMTSENWALMIDICDDVLAKDQKARKQCLISVKKRLNHRDPHVVLLALSLLDCLWNNCDSSFRREVSSKEFINELTYKATNSNRVVGEKTRELIKKWAENECKNDNSLSLIESLYRDLINEGYSFDSNPNSDNKKKFFSNNANVVSTEQEEADIARAIALSLDDVKDKKQSQSIYPTSSEMSNQTNTYNNVEQTQSQRQVKALYDFEAAEDNELSFTAGDIITITDDSDPNWWRGLSSRGNGLFPASFVTSDLKENTDYLNKCNTNSKSEEEEEEEQNLQTEMQQPEISEEILRKCYQLLQDCDPTGELPDPPELAYYEQMSLAQASLIDQKLALIDKQHNMLAQIDVAIRDVLANYDNAVQQMQNVYTHSNEIPLNPGKSTVVPHVAENYKTPFYSNYSCQQTINAPENLPSVTPTLLPISHLTNFQSQHQMSQIVPYSMNSEAQNARNFVPNGGNVVLPNNGNVVLPNNGNIALSNSVNMALPNNGNIGLPNSGNMALPNNGNIGLPNSGNIGLPNSGNIALSNSGNIALPNSGNEMQLNNNQQQFINQPQIYQQ